MDPITYRWNHRCCFSPPPHFEKLCQHRPQIAKTNFCVIKHTTCTPPKMVVTPPHHSTLQRHPAMAPRPLLRSRSSPSPPTKAHCNGTTSTPPMAPRPIPQSWSSPSPPTIAHYNGTLQWHHVHSAKIGRHPPNQSTLQCHHVHSPKVGRHRPPPTIAHYNGTLQRHPAMAQWHPAMAPRPLNQSWSSPSPQPWHTTMAPYEGTQQWHHVHRTLQWHPAIAPSNGTTSTQP